MDHVDHKGAPSALRNPAASELPELLAEQEESGLSLAEFARVRGLKPRKLYKARGRQRPETESAPVFDAIQISALAPPVSSYELVLVSGHRLSIPADFDSPSLRRLLEVVSTC